jgi:hypothetical protein
LDNEALGGFGFSVWVYLLGLSIFLILLFCSWNFESRLASPVKLAYLVVSALYLLLSLAMFSQWNKEVYGVGNIRLYAAVGGIGFFLASISNALKYKCQKESRMD